MFQYTVKSDVGRKREVNEDRAAVLERPDGLLLAVVADGMGGHNAGDLASAMTVEELSRLFLASDSESFLAVSDKKRWLSAAARRVNNLIYNYAKTHPACSGMGTTLVAAIIDSDECVLCHIGDSRVYLFNGSTEQVTRDHSYVNLLVDNGELSQEEAEVHPKKNLILKALGTEPDLEEDLLHISLAASSYLLICSDGLSNKLSASEMTAILSSSRSLAEKGVSLIDRANELGGEDNISLVLFSSKGEEG